MAEEALPEVRSNPGIIRDTDICVFNVKKKSKKVKSTSVLCMEYGVRSTLKVKVDRFTKVYPH